MWKKNLSETKLFAVIPSQGYISNIVYFYSDGTFYKKHFYIIIQVTISSFKD